MNSWERQSKEVDNITIVEPLNAYAAFSVYYRLPPNERSLEKVAEIMELSLRILVHWATEWYWISRADAFDGHNVREKLLTKSSIYAQNMETYSQSRKTVAGAQKGFGIDILNKCKARLLALDPTKIPVNLIPSFIKSGLDLVNSGIDNEGKALGVDELAIMLEDKVNKKKKKRSSNKQEMEQ